jgi:hypothetical protein
MKVLLQHAENGRYLCPSGLWEDNLNRATSFGDVGTALSFCCEHDVHAVNILFAFDDGDLNFSVKGPRPLR